MITITEKEKCTGCGACYNCCPKNAIVMESDQEGFLYPVIEEKKCIDCKLCEKICPINVNQKEQKESIFCYGGFIKEQKIRTESSSGGIFTAIAQQVLSQNGVVFGAAFSNDFKSVKHIAIKNIGELDKFRGSKYVQSEINNTYKQVKEILKTGKQVLFSGTPCQVAGLTSYLGKKYSNLITIDFICHGVPSPLVWRKYTEEVEHNYKNKIVECSFRNKKFGWKNYSLKLLFENGNYFCQKASENLYMKGFLSNLFLRPSCHNCKFKDGENQSDITVADFWGIENVLPELDIQQGVSLIFINTSKGNLLFSSIKDNIFVQEVPFDKAIKFNPAYRFSAKKHKNRNDFFDNLNKHNVSYLISKYTRISIAHKIVYLIWRILQKLK